MDSKTCLDASEAKKRAYTAPDLVAFGDAKEMTRNVNQNGGGDVLFNLLVQNS